MIQGSFLKKILLSCCLLAYASTMYAEVKYQDSQIKNQMVLEHLLKLNDKAACSDHELAILLKEFDIQSVQEAESLLMTCYAIGFGVLVTGALSVSGYLLFKSCMESCEPDPLNTDNV